ncbi:MAG: hypothetical protein Q9162_000685 [Coniocarpon cinnabarinum]
MTPISRARSTTIDNSYTPILPVSTKSLPRRAWCDELYYYLTQNGPLEPSFVQRIFAQIVGAVAYIHSKSCVHRDLKLENLLLDKNKNVKLCDFGFTREYEGKSSYLQTWCGTVCYAAPEMLKGEKYAGEKVDVWSLGVILYALLCGQLPFDEDDESQTKSRIMKDEPKYPDTMPQGAKELINILLSKRPLLRPSLRDILANPWLAEHAPGQQAILKLQQPTPFATPLEKDTLQRMRSAGVNIDMVIEHVLSQRCDSLAGWWALLLEKEERKFLRRERKRKERDADAKAARRMSAASARLERIAPTIKESEEEDVGGQATRGREMKRPSMLVDSTRPSVPDMSKTLPPTPKGSSRERPPSAQHTVHNPRRRSQLAHRDFGKRASGISVVAAPPEHPPVEPSGPKKGRKRYPQPFMHQLASIKHWFKETSKRAKSPNQQRPDSLHPDAARRPGGPEPMRLHSDGVVPRRSVSRPRPDLQSRSTYPARPRVATNASNGSGRRLSMSPSPLTPSGSYRRSTGSNLRGRQSTSSSVSSMRSFHAHHQSLSVASSTSSNSIASPTLSVKQNMVGRRASPNLSTLKVLPRTPTGPSFPNDTRPGRRAPGSLSLGQEGPTSSPFSGLGPPSPGLMFATRKRTPFKGPMLGPGSNSRKRSTTSSAEGSVSGHGRRSGEIIEEEDEDVEEVETFSPVEGPASIEEFFPTPPPPSSVQKSPEPASANGSGTMQQETLKALERTPD